jgi:RHH-type proline utilization regulon transcriptional repressor/proline dehydrogenase/delta 1-pyrroline-5-carboxylate dehydrogenase
VTYSYLSTHLTKREDDVITDLLSALNWDETISRKIRDAARGMIESIRARKLGTGELEAFLRDYDLTSQEGMALMSLAEALLRIPDRTTQDQMIHDVLQQGDWKSLQSNDWVIKASGLGLEFSKGFVNSALSRLGAPVLRKAMKQAMTIMGGQFVLGETMQAALKRSVKYQQMGYCFSYDMLGEGARTLKDANIYFDHYKNSLHACIDYLPEMPAGALKPGISVKLSAICPFYHAHKHKQAVPFLIERLMELVTIAAKHHLCLTIDAEESSRLGLSLEIIKAVIKRMPKDWRGFGLAVQAYQKRAMPFIDDLYTYVQSQGAFIQIRLVKGAYWDTEIKMAQIDGVEDYPVFTRKTNTDTSWLACAKKLLSYRDCFYPMFATHNVFSVMAILEMDRLSAQQGFGLYKGYEFQRLWGMGQALYDSVLAQHKVACRIYAPVGIHTDLLPYLVRRLLENGSSSSFVHHLRDHDVPIEDLLNDPVFNALTHAEKRHPKIPCPPYLFKDRLNSKGFFLYDLEFLTDRIQLMRDFIDGADHLAAPSFKSVQKSHGLMAIHSPADHKHIIGHVLYAIPEDVETAFKNAKKAFPAWNDRPAHVRIEILNKIADLMEAEQDALLSLCVFEAGKTIADALAELREAVDFCRYYAVQAAHLYDHPDNELIGYTGESNICAFTGRGVMVCISPWNFPLAIFTGQIVACLVTGNAVIAKPAEQTPLIASYFHDLAIRAGVPDDVFIVLPAAGDIGAALVEHPDTAGVLFTGSTQVAHQINRTLAAKNGAITPFIAETGGLNVMIADSSALVEQLVDDVILSAFGSAGQRCSALRVLYVQHEIADKVIEMLKGAMDLLKVGHPIAYDTDIAPVIDEQARKMLIDHRESLRGFGHILAETPLDKDQEHQGTYFAPCLFEIHHLNELTEEKFGAILHIIRYKKSDMDQIMDDIAQSGYGLTFGIHSRVESFIQQISKAAPVGNVYINRSMTGAVVGVHPFGGHGLSGTGFKAGGRHYLLKLIHEKTITRNITASGGNISLVNLSEVG